MKRILKNTAIGIMGLAFSAAVMPAQDAHGYYGGGNPYQTASPYYGDRDHDAYRSRARDEERRRYEDRYREGYQDHDGDRYRSDYSYGDRDFRYGDRDGDRGRGRDTAIVIGSAAGGAAIGAAAGHGRGALAGAIVGGVGGLIADEAIRHHDRDRH